MLYYRQELVSARDKHGQIHLENQEGFELGQRGKSLLTNLEIDIAQPERCNC